MTGRAVNVSRTISMIALLTSILMFVGIDGMGHGGGHTLDRSAFHQGKFTNQLLLLYLFHCLFRWLLYNSFIYFKGDSSVIFIYSILMYFF